jgi:hypothetical protein
MAIETLCMVSPQEICPMLTDQSASCQDFFSIHIYFMNVQPYSAITLWENENNEKEFGRVPNLKIDNWAK